LAKDWYLISQENWDITGGDLSPADDFSSILNEGIGESVELWESNLKSHKTIVGVIQNSVGDTTLKTMSRVLLTPIGTCKAGMYIQYKDIFWLITGFVDNNTMYEKSILTMCTYKLTWIDRNNNIVERWANITSASQYNNGETGNKYYYVRSNQLLVWLPDDEDCLRLDSGFRFIIDKRTGLYDKEIPDGITDKTDFPLMTYMLTRADSVIYSFQSTGTTLFIFSQDEQRSYDGYHNGYWVCGTVDQSSEAVPERITIQSDSDEIYDGLDPVEFTAFFYDSNGSVIDGVPLWTIEGNNKDLLIVHESGVKISIAANDIRLIGSKFKLTVSSDNYPSTTVEFSVVSFM